MIEDMIISTSIIIIIFPADGNVSQVVCQNDRSVCAYHAVGRTATRTSTALHIHVHNNLLLKLYNYSRCTVML